MKLTDLVVYDESGVACKIQDSYSIAFVREDGSMWYWNSETMMIKDSLDEKSSSKTMSFRDIFQQDVKTIEFK